LRNSLLQAEHIQTELDRRVYYMKTLYDDSRDIFGSVEYEPILKNFLMMTMGNFGVAEGFILTVIVPSKEINGFVSVGFQDGDISLLRTGGSEILLSDDLVKSMQNEADLKCHGLLPPATICAFSFNVDTDCSGIMGLGAKLIGEPYNTDDQELLDTLVNNLVVALKNARSFEEIKSLNKDLQEKNVHLNIALDHLKASMRKVEILESIKENLSKFVPVTVSRMIEKSPTNAMPESKKQDLSVLFVDIEGYTKLCEKLGGSAINEVIEKHFSAFMDAIYANNGDVNETAGDGLMVLFLNEDEETNALEAVRTALDIRDKSVRIFKECSALNRPLDINMGINSGQALVGAAKFETYSGSRWTYTARGNLANIAARVGAQASGGRIFLSKSTADRVKGQFSPKPKGRFKLKNVSEEIEIFEL
ncbi:MAG: adenylate/guanylate cyclase domain-containing protein, partial [Desulfatirhabdiaceae bacterium]|nr:adenylate/guanylate cyclase domain-containing protein [Desulfatirhabdiaceae bacterium]